MTIVQVAVMGIVAVALAAKAAEAGVFRLSDSDCGVSDRIFRNLEA